MEVLTIPDCYLRAEIDRRGVMKVASEGLAIKTSENQLLTIPKDDIRNAELFYGLRKMTLRVYAKELYEIYNIDQNLTEQLKSCFSAFFKIALYLKELEIADVLSGELSINAQRAIEFRSKKCIFDLPIKSVESVVDIRNEISIATKDAEIRFVTNKETIGDIKEGCCATIDDEMLALEDVSVIFPRGKFNFVFFRDYMRVVGSSYEHKIPYKSIRSLYVLEKGHLSEVDRYVLLGVDPAVRQGQTRYDFLVLSFDDVETEIAVEDERLERGYSGLLADSFVKIIQSLCVTRAIHSGFETKERTRCLRCSTKAYEGQLYPLDDCLLFLPRAIRLGLGDISLVEFSRVNISTMQAKTFDMTVFCDGTHTFSGLSKDEFGALEQYFAEKKIKARSEVIEDVISSAEEDEGYGSAEDSLVASSEEDRYESVDDEE
jgi:structure-specific recognition protein 1